MSRRISSGVGRGPLRGLDFQCKYALKPARCQRITVSGLTIFKASSTPGARRYNPANTRRSMRVKVSRCGDLRHSTLVDDEASRSQLAATLATGTIRSAPTKSGCKHLSSTKGIAQFDCAY